jgi:hypothetical protein
MHYPLKIEEIRMKIIQGRKYRDRGFNRETPDYRLLCICCAVMIKSAASKADNQIEGFLLQFLQGNSILARKSG